MEDYYLGQNPQIITVKMPSELVARIKARENWSNKRSQIIRRAIREYLDRLDAEDKAQIKQKLIARSTTRRK